MNVRESIVDGLTDVGTHKLRTFLQTLGVVLGVASLVAVQGLADSGRRPLLELGGSPSYRNSATKSEPPRNSPATA